MINKEQSDMIDMLIEGKTISDISKLLNKSRPTIYAWLKLEFINEELEKRKLELIRSARDKVSSKIENYIDNVIELANNCSDSRVRLQANRYLIDRVLGSPTAMKIDIYNAENNDKEKDVNALKAEMEEIKRISLVK
ncbi:helix-turn-helix domain-containing protein [Clostridium sp. HCS.1]|uniref:helix-turn-helix domain-containing protein n=1 Tax=Clostridium sp. HCS.1 TaxID=3238594 RepID=UPI003A102141